MFEVGQPSWQDFLLGWELGLYRDPVLCGIIAGCVLGYLGVFVILKRMVFVTAAISQASGLGVALTFYLSIHIGLQIHPMVGALVLALATAGLLSVRVSPLGLSRESLLGFGYLAMWATSVLVGDRIVQESHDISGIIFGTAVVVQSFDVILITSVGFGVVALYLFFHRGFAFASFDSSGAQVQGVPVRFLDLMSWVLLALFVSVATKVLGVLPVFAFAVLPAMTALMTIRTSLRWVLFLASLLGALSGAMGYLAAFFLEFPVGACQAIIAVMFFLIFLPIRIFRL